MMNLSTWIDMEGYERSSAFTRAEVIALIQAAMKKQRDDIIDKLYYAVSIAPIENQQYRRGVGVAIPIVHAVVEENMK